MLAAIRRKGNPGGVEECSSHFILSACSCLMLLLLLSSSTFAHEVRPAYLEIRQTAPETYDILWKVPGQGENLRLGLYVEFPEGCTNLREPRGTMVGGAFTERWSVHCAGGLTGGTVRIAGLTATTTDVLVRVEMLDGRTAATIVHPSQPWLTIAGSQSWWEVAGVYGVQGIRHILFGVDHLLFVLGLLLIVKGRMKLLKTITAFTVAHSITLGIATLGYATVPLPPLNAGIALSILFLGPEIVRARRGDTSLTIRFPWVVSFLFGLLHGFGFASGLSTTGMPRVEIPLALLFFNLGVEFGQLVFVFSAFALARSFKVLQVRWPQWAEAMPGYVVGSLGAYWTIQRTVMLLGGPR